MNLREIIRSMDLNIEDVADYLGLSYFDTAQIIKGEKSCNNFQREKLKIFLIQNYTKCIDEALKII